MRFQFQRITQPLDLGDYHESYRGQVLQVWVNLPREKRQERVQLLRGLNRWLQGQVPALPAAPKKGRLRALLAWLRRPPEKPSQLAPLKEQLDEWLAEILSQHPDESTHCSAAQLREMDEIDPALHTWLTQKAVALIDGFRAEEKKT